MAELLADSYAFIEYASGNAAYGRLFEQHSVVTTALNVVEVYASMLRRGVDPERARLFAQTCLTKVVEVPSGAVLRAAEFRAEMARKRLNCSHIDAWGYAAAEALGRRFLTGDESFHGLPNVLFVK